MYVSKFSSLCRFSPLQPFLRVLFKLCFQSIYIFLFLFFFVFHFIVSYSFWFVLRRRWLCLAVFSSLIASLVIRQTATNEQLHMTFCGLSVSELGSIVSTLL